MESEGISEAFATFINSHFDSVAQIEMLLLFHANDTTRYSPQEVTTLLRGNEDAIVQWMHRLVAVGLLQQHGDTYSYAPATDEKARGVELLALMYPRFRVRIIDLVYSRPNRMRHFSEAFRIKKDPESNG